MCAPRLTRHTSIRYSSCCHTRVNMGASIFLTAAMIRAFRSARSHVTGGTTIRTLIFPKEKITGVMSGDLGGHSPLVGHFQTHTLSNVVVTLFRYWETSQWKWAGLPSCGNMNVGMFCNCGISHSCNMSRYVMPVTVSSAKKNGPTLFDWRLHKTHSL